MEEKVTVREALKVHARAMGDIQKLCPRLFLSVVLSAVVSAVIPYVTVFFSACIINELAGLRRPEELWRWVLWTVVSAGVLALLRAVLQRWENHELESFDVRKERLFINKMFSMDFVDVDNQATHDKLSQIDQNEMWAGWGLLKLPYRLKDGVEAFVGIVSAAALTVSLFTLPVPETAGKLVALNNPLFILLLLALGAAICAVSGLCNNKVSALWAGAAKTATLGNRIFNGFGFVGEDKERAPDIRMYEQQDITRHYLCQNNSFAPGGVMARLAAGAMGIYNCMAVSVLAVFTGFVYMFACLKAWGGAFGIGSVTQYVSAVTALASNVSNLLDLVGELKSNTTFLNLTYDLLDTPNSMYQGSLTTEKRSDRNYEVEFRNVSFKYPGTETYALRNVSIKFRVGQRLAVVGENGSGKTTFIKLLCRLYDPDEGEILLNGINIRKYDYRDYMNIFSVVFQDFQLLSQPLGQNVAGSREYDRERARRALEDAGFGERLASLPDGLDTQLYKEFGEEGVDVSGGEAQKIAIARALYKDAPFIILDEPTAALDPIAEAEIYSKFNDIAGDKTAIYISHRLSSCKFCDEIAVFHEGAVIQQGTHDDLVAEENGKYYELWNAQAQYYTEKSVS